MYLTREEEYILQGGMGFELQEAISGMVKLGDVFDADRMVKISSAHIIGLPLCYDKDRIEHVKRETDRGLRFQCTTTTNTVGFDNAPEIDVHSNVNEAMGSFELRSRLKRSLEVCDRLGAKLTCTCAPYITERPGLGESVAWTESGAFIVANSLFGSRSNREGQQSAYWSALLGRTPRYGMHRTEFRKATILFELRQGSLTTSDYGALGYYIGEQAETLWEVPAISGCRKATLEQLNSFAGGLSSSGAVAMFHMIGVTPEAPSAEAVFIDRKAEDKVVITCEEIESIYEKLNTADDDHIQMVALGCPHATLQEIAYIADLLKGKRIDKSIKLWVYCPPPIRREVHKLGYDTIIEGTGANVLCGGCLLQGTFSHKYLQEFPWRKEINVIATNSAKMSHYAHLTMGWNVWFGTTEECIKASISGRWKVSR